MSTQTGLLGRGTQRPVQVVGAYIHEADSLQTLSWRDAAVAELLLIDGLRQEKRLIPVQQEFVASLEQHTLAQT